MNLRIALFLCWFIALSGARVGAQEKAVCTLLTPGEVSGALGSAKAGVESEMPVPGAPEGTTVKLCSWPLTNAAGGLHLSASKIPPTISFDSLVAQSFQQYDQLKAKGWTEEKKDFGSVKCVTAKPPAGKPDDPLTTNCMAKGKGMFLGATTLTKTPVTMEKVKALIDSAMARLP